MIPSRICRAIRGASVVRVGSGFGLSPDSQHYLEALDSNLQRPRLLLVGRLVQSHFKLISFLDTRLHYPKLYALHLVHLRVSDLLTPCVGTLNVRVAAVSGHNLAFDLFIYLLSW
jgi:hypothetical protein